MRTLRLRAVDRAGPNTRALLEHNVRVNKHENVEIVACAAGASHGQIEMFRSATNLANHAINRNLVPNVQDSVLVDVRTVDELCASRLGGRSPTVLKIDVEGWEWEVLHGAAGVIDRARPVIWLEYWPLGIRANGHDPRAVVDLMYDHGYTVTAHDLVIESPVDISGDEIIAYCDEATERFKQAGRFELHGILYLHATQGRPPVVSAGWLRSRTPRRHRTRDIDLRLDPEPSGRRRGSSLRS